MDWDRYFIEVAEVVSRKSKDPSSQIGAVIVGPERQIISTGFNGFPRGIDEGDATRWERPAKYMWVEHAERNAVYNAARHGIALRGCTLYLYGFGPIVVPCTECSKALIQSGIVEIVGYAAKTHTGWDENLKFSEALLDEAGIKVREYKINLESLDLESLALDTVVDSFFDAIKGLKETPFVRKVDVAEERNKG
jgi:dCMP deaminase